MFHDEIRYVIFKGATGWYFRRVGTDRCFGPYDTKIDAENKAALQELGTVLGEMGGHETTRGN